MAAFLWRLKSWFLLQILQTSLLTLSPPVLVLFVMHFRMLVCPGVTFICRKVLLRKVNEVGMKVAYERDNKVRGSIRCLAALSFIPVTDIVESFEILAEPMPPVELMNELLNYLEHTYVRGRRLRGSRGVVLWRERRTLWK